MDRDASTSKEPLPENGWPPRPQGGPGRRRRNSVAGSASLSGFGRPNPSDQYRLSRLITSVRGDRVRQDMKRVLNAEFIISQRTALDLEIRNGRKRVAGWALNDALITRGSNPNLIGINARIGQRRLTSYRCDSLILPLAAMR